MTVRGPRPELRSWRYSRETSFDRAKGAYRYTAGSCGKSFALKEPVREGFEPSVAFWGYNALAKRRFRPLSHLTLKIGRNLWPRLRGRQKHFPATYQMNLF